MRFSTNISLYLGNVTRQGHGYYGTPIGTRMRSCQMVPFLMTLNDPNPCSFKCTPLFDVEYLRNSTI